MTDIMSREKRSALMARIRGKNTGIERTMSSHFERRGLVPERHAADLPGTPDFVFRDSRVVVFVDGDFWHGWRFPAWQQKFTDPWRPKITETRRRDRRNFAQLRRAGWTVVRLWEHQIRATPERHADTIAALIVSIKDDSGQLRPDGPVS